MTLAQLPHDLRIEIVVSWSKQLARNFDPASSLPDLKRLLLTLKQREHAELTTGAPPSVPMEAGIRLALEEVARKALAQPPRATGQDEQIRTLDTLLLLLLPIPGDLMVAAQNWVGQRLTVATEVSDRKRSALPQPPVALTHGLGFAVGQDLA